MPEGFKREWVRFVRGRLSPLGLDGPRESEIVEELAEHLEAAYEEALASGDTEEEARAEALAQFPDWQLLECELSRAERRAVAWRSLHTPSGHVSGSRGGGFLMLESISPIIAAPLNFISLTAAHATGRH